MNLTVFAYIGWTRSLDRSVYSEGMGRMWRLPNRQRSDNRCFKIPLSIGEALYKPYADLQALTVRPRRGIFWPTDEELAPCPALVQLYRETVAAIERTAPQPFHRNHKEIEPSGEVSRLLDSCTFLRHCREEAAVLTEPEWYAMVSNVGRCADGAEAVH